MKIQVNKPDNWTPKNTADFLREVADFFESLRTVKPTEIIIEIGDC